MSTSQDKAGRASRTGPTPTVAHPPSSPTSTPLTGPLSAGLGKATDASHVNPVSGPNAPQAGKPAGSNLPAGLALLGQPDVASNPIVDAIIQQQELARKRLEWTAHFDTEYNRMKSARANFERQWYLNIAFTAGQHYIAPMNVAGQGFRLTVPKAPAHRVRLTVNKIRTVVRKEAAKLSSSQPIPTVVPATGEDEDYAAARVGEALVRTQFADKKFTSTTNSWIWWGVVCGISYMKSWWDPTSLDYDCQKLPDINSILPAMPDGTPPPPELVDVLLQQSPKLQEYLQTPQPAVGKICYERITPFHIYVPDLLVEDLEEQPYVVQVMTRSPLWVKNAFPAQYPGDQMPVCDSRSSNTVMDSVQLITKNAPENNDAVLVKEVWIKPNGHKDFPKGGMLTIVGGRVVQEKTTWPCPFPEYPYYAFRGIPTGGFYPDSVVQDLIPLNKEYNKKRSQAIEIQNMMGKPKFLYPQGSINLKMVNTEAGQGIPYTPGYEKPTLLPGVEVPTSFVNEITMLSQEIDDISGQHEISRGDVPGEVKSGTAISFLAEQDDTMLAYSSASIEHAMQYVGKHFLSYVSKYWEGDRLIKIAGNDNQYEALMWKQNSLKGNTDVRIQSGSALPISKAARTAQITEFMQNGWLPPEEGFEMMQMGGMDKVLDQLMGDKRQAQRENLKMAQLPERLITMMMNPAPGPNGEPPLPPVPNPTNPNLPPIQRNFDGTPFAPQPPVPVNTWDNHAAHIEYHNAFRKTQEFEILPEANKQAFELHVQMHMRAGMSQMINSQGAELTSNPQPEPPMLPPGADGNNGEPPADAGVNDGGAPPQEQSA